MDEKPFTEYVRLANHYLATGTDQVYLCGEKPWSIATEFEPGGSHRLDISTSGWFSGNHPCGLRFRWSFDIEKRSANGSGSYQIDVEAIQRVLAKVINPKCRVQFLEYIADCAEKIEKRADEFQQEASKQYGQASALRRAVKVG